MIEYLDWHNSYRRGWNGLIVPAAFAHPAKISFSLAEKIYDFLLESGMVKAGDAVVDPFGGIAGTGLSAMKRGLHWTGVELEEKFVALGNANIALWEAKFSTLPHWGSARLVQGDSRNLAEVVREAHAAISSPPYSSYALPTNDGPAAAAFRMEIAKQRGVTPDQVTSLDYRTLKTYNADNPNNLGNLPEGDYRAAISSPPYAHISPQKSSDGVDLEKQYATYRKSGGGASFEAFCKTQHFHSQGYGASSGQLANLREGDFQAVISSPPYSEARIGESSGAENVGRNENYGNGNGQLGNMQGGDFSAAILSPPYAGTPVSQTHMTSNKRGDKSNPNYRPSWETKLAQGFADTVRPYGETDRQLGAMSEGNFNAAVSSPPYENAVSARRDGIDWIKAGRPDRMRPSANAHYPQGVHGEFRYGDAVGNLGNMRGDDFNAAVSSPPYEAVASRDRSKESYQMREDKQQYRRPNAGINIQDGYNSANANNLGNDSGETFWLASRTIVEQVHSVLAPGAVSVWVVKRFVRKGEIVEFSQQWAQLCEAVGFETTHWIRAWLVESDGIQQQFVGETPFKLLKTERKSFFRRLHEKKYPHTAINWEDVIVMRKR